MFQSNRREEKKRNVEEKNRLHSLSSFYRDYRQVPFFLYASRIISFRLLSKNKVTRLSYIRRQHRHQWKKNRLSFQFQSLPRDIQRWLSYENKDRSRDTLVMQALFDDICDLFERQEIRQRFQLD